MAAAYNQSIYLMVSMPYLLLGFFGFLIWRGVKKNEEFRRQIDADNPRKDAPHTEQ